MILISFQSVRRFTVWNRGGSFLHRCLFRRLLILFLLVGLSCVVRFLAPIPSLHSFEGIAMTMGYHVTVGQPLSSAQIQEIEEVIEQTFQEVHEHCNPWNPESEIARLNQAEGAVFILSPLLARLISLVDQCVKETDGLFDPTIGPIWGRWCFALMQQELLSSKDLERMKPLQGWNKLTLAGHVLVKKHPGIQLDVCGLAKGFCVDLLAERLRFLGVENGLVEWGGEVYAWGSHPEKRSWSIALADRLPNGEELDLGVVDLCERALASSGISQRYWTVEKKNYYHFVHPKTLKVLSQDACFLLLCSVEADSCVFADAYATACMLFTSQEEIQHWFEKQHRISRLWALLHSGERLLLEKSVGQTNCNFQNVGTLSP
ncbi:FAD:protein FMN transferase [Candidatus Similichlamydia laticola]|uniref:FAD:protein FMN transferase n=1 Tax=Candidatus Similichlamydia laticola TaxID=2170265 RepID=A0A369KDA8_9BACT|nr:FAD:protein FMN transferase [Candidatus Similichlamydia laticola]RDB31592.1 thiamine biosynthesis lipoprotein ApbE [Candidatus Similichlamydia laticola]